MMFEDCQAGWRELGEGEGCWRKDVKLVGRRDRVDLRKERDRAKGRGLNC